jgi:hypothetical protein
MQEIELMEYTLRDGKGKIVTICPPELMLRYVSTLPDGDYNMTGPDTDLVIELRKGVAYPTAGKYRGEVITPMPVGMAKAAMEFMGCDTSPKRRKKQ